MAIVATYRASTVVLGSSLGPGGGPYLEDTAQTTPDNTNAPPPQAYTLQAGFNALVIPSGYTVSRVQLMPPSGSTNAKTVKGVTGDTGLAGWTAGSVTLPAVAGSTVGVLSAGIETLTAAFS